MIDRTQFVILFEIDDHPRTLFIHSFTERELKTISIRVSYTRGTSYPKYDLAEMGCGWSADFSLFSAGFSINIHLMMCEGKKQLRITVRVQLNPFRVTI